MTTSVDIKNGTNSELVNVPIKRKPRKTLQEKIRSAQKLLSGYKSRIKATKTEGNEPTKKTIRGQNNTQKKLNNLIEKRNNKRNIK